MMKLGELKLQNEFISIISHDLKNPLGTLGLNLFLLEKCIQSLSGDQKILASEQLQIMHNCINDMTDLIISARNIMTILSGHYKINRKVSSLINLLDQIANMFRARIGNKGIHIVVKQPDQEIYVRLDQERFLQVFLILLNNILRFLPQNGKLTLELLKQDQEIQISVLISGIGMALTESDYFRSEYELDFTKKILKKHNGKISIKNEKDLISKLCISLPVFVQNIQHISNKKRTFL